MKVFSKSIINILKGKSQCYNTINNNFTKNKLNSVSLFNIIYKTFCSNEVIPNKRPRKMILKSDSKVVKDSTKKEVKKVKKEDEKIEISSSIAENKEKNFSLKDIKNKIFIPSVTIVRSKEHARKCVEILFQYKDRFHAWDTETVGINPKEQSPVGNGKIICLSCFIGPDVDFGNGPRLFIDNYGDCEDLVQEFKEYFENPNYYKVWHNYGFDRHIIYNHGINVRYAFIILLFNQYFFIYNY